MLVTASHLGRAGSRLGRAGLETVPQHVGCNAARMSQPQSYLALCRGCRSVNTSCLHLPPGWRDGGERAAEEPAEVQGEPALPWRHCPSTTGASAVRPGRSCFWRRALTAATCCGTVRASRGSTASACCIRVTFIPTECPRQKLGPGVLRRHLGFTGGSFGKCTTSFQLSRNLTKASSHPCSTQSSTTQKLHVPQGEMTAVTSTCSQHEAISQSDMTVPSSTASSPCSRTEQAIR